MSVGLGVALAAAVAAMTGGAPPTGPEIVHPVWVTGPRPENLAHVSTPSGGSGQVEMRCAVAADGGLKGCVVVKETPEGGGLGAAALGFASLYRMAPLTADGVPTAGGSVSVSIPFGPRLAGPPKGPPAAVIRNPDWERIPSEDELSRYFPSGASSTGRAVLECTVTAQGQLSDCVVAAEDPPNQGFGAAALMMAHAFKMRPETRDGRPVAGAKISIPIRFGSYGGDPPAWKVPPTLEALNAVRPHEAGDDSGLVNLDCLIERTGLASDCHIKSEAPRGDGFGAAIMKLVPTFLFTPGTQNGAPTAMRSTLSFTFPAPAARQTGMGSYGLLTGLTNAPWALAPSAAEVAGAWPKQAPPGLASGHATLRCRFAADSTLGGCAVENEAPEGAGFGAAALSLKGRFMVRGMDGTVLSTARINLPFTFTNPAVGSAAPTQITEADWVGYVAADTMTSLYPDAASKAGIKTGRGIVTCTVQAGGELAGCAVTQEDPAGLGFGASAVQAASYFTLNPWTNDGRPVDGAKISLPIRFIEDPSPPDGGAPAAKDGGGKPAG